MMSQPHSLESLRDESHPRLIARVPAVALGELRELRTARELLVCVVDGDCWIRPASASQDVPHADAAGLRTGLAAEVFEVTADGFIIPRGCRVPIGSTPSGPWLPIAQRFPVRLPEIGFPSHRIPATRLKLVRSDRIVDCTLLEVPFSRFEEFARKTSILRLNRWEFSVSQAGAALVRGIPLPTIPGRRYWEVGGILIPAGWTWFPALAPEVLRRVLKFVPGESAVLRLNSTNEPDSFDWERIPEDAFVKATRPNFRATLEQLSASRVAEGP